MMIEHALSSYLIEYDAYGRGDSEDGREGGDDGSDGVCIVPGLGDKDEDEVDEIYSGYDLCDALKKRERMRQLERTPYKPRESLTKAFQMSVGPVQLLVDLLKVHPKLVKYTKVAPR